jgi:hypothetical protein
LALQAQELVPAPVGVHAAFASQPPWLTPQEPGARAPGAGCAGCAGCAAVSVGSAVAPLGAAELHPSKAGAPPPTMAAMSTTLCHSFADAKDTVTSALSFMQSNGSLRQSLSAQVRSASSLRR